MSFWVVPCQSGLQVASPVPHDAGKAYRFLSSEPTYTTPPETVGDEWIELCVVPCHSGVQVASPAQEAGNAYRLPSPEPTYTTPSATAGEEKLIGPPVAAVQLRSSPDTVEGLKTFSYGL